MKTDWRAILDLVVVGVELIFVEGGFVEAGL